MKYLAICYWLSNCPALCIDFAEEVRALEVHVQEVKMKKMLSIGGWDWN
jgi:hypothetical protein